MEGFAVEVFPLRVSVTFAVTVGVSVTLVVTIGI